MTKHTFSQLLITLLLALTACTSTSPSNPNQTIFFPRQEKTKGERAVMEADITGRLVLVNNCIRINHAYSDTSYLLIFPPDFNMTINNGSIDILNEDGKIVADFADQVRLGGGEIKSLSMLPEFIQKQIPPQCPGPYWVVGDW
jgi:hypothetical protein